MTTKVNLPCFMGFVDAAAAEEFLASLSVIIPKVQFEQLDDNNFVFFTRKDQKYRDLVGVNIQAVVAEAQ